VRNMLAEHVGVGAVIDDRIGVIIGTHVGPGGLIVAFWGRARGS
jgi:sorbitol-specific phosphotransferase system component IIBC